MSSILEADISKRAEVDRDEGVESAAREKVVLWLFCCLFICFCLGSS